MVLGDVYMTYLRRGGLAALRDPYRAGSISMSLGAGLPASGEMVIG